MRKGQIKRVERDANKYVATSSRSKRKKMTETVKRGKNGEERIAKNQKKKHRKE